MIFLLQQEDKVENKNLKVHISKLNANSSAIDFYFCTHYFPKPFHTKTTIKFSHEAKKHNLIKAIMVIMYDILVNLFTLITEIKTSNFQITYIF